MKSFFCSAFIIFNLISANNPAQPIRLITLDPGHFHAALVQKTMYKEINPVVHIYAPVGDDLKFHIERIRSYNERIENPTKWKLEVYTGNDFFEKMLEERAGNVVVLSGNNKNKTEYILKSVEAGFSVLADKPMAINKDDFEILKEAFSVAADKDLLIYDIMTERFEITTILQKEFSLLPEIFGALMEGSPENPAVIKESVHHFFKEVSGEVLTRPAWFFDTNQEGEGLVDVMTHLVDLVQWECFPGEIINYSDIEVIKAKRWPTEITYDEFKTVTKLEEIPSYLKKNSADNNLNIYCNGEINYKIKGIHASTSVRWAYKTPSGSGDTHYSLMRGTKANLVIKQGVKENFKPVLYLEPVININDDYEKSVNAGLMIINGKYPGIQLIKKDNLFEVIIPGKYREGHEAHFAGVTRNFIKYFKKDLPVWEKPNMLSKYFTTIKALEIASE